MKIERFAELISEKKFINVVKNLTIFVEEYKNDNVLNKIYINEKIDNNQSKIIVADSGKIIHSQKNKFGHISTYTQDTVIKAKLNDAQQRKFSRNLIKNVKENSQLSPEMRRKKAEESSREFIKELS